MLGYVHTVLDSETARAAESDLVQCEPIRYVGLCSHCTG